MNTRLILQYLKELSENNNREWYHLHKEEYKEANAQFEELLRHLILAIGQTDSSILHNHPGDLTFKLVRDTRFSHDKSPYNPAFLGGGLFADMFKEATAMIRDYIVKHPDEWDEIIHAAKFEKYFTVQGTALKNVPAGYDKEHPQAAFLKYKSWYLEYHVEDEAFLHIDTLFPQMVEVFETMKPFNDYLNKALAGFQMPART